jgi:hypothetical protein
MTAVPAPAALSRRLLKRHIALPGDHGAWVFLLSPLFIGFFVGRAAGGAWSASAAWLTLAALAAFFLRQPVSIAVKAASGRRDRQELPAALFWSALYSAVALLAAAVLLARGVGQVLLLALPAGPVFAWHLWLIRRRAERRQLGVELAGSGVLALAAPAACWVMLGRADPLGWWLWLLAWLQSAASIVYAYLRLEQRILKTWPPVPQRWRMGWRACLYAGFNFLFAVVLAGLRFGPPLLPLPFVLQLAETVWGTFNPAVGVRPTRIGLRQLLVSSLFTLAFILVW